MPCTHCEKKRHPCRWTASYGRGRPPTPPPADQRSSETALTPTSTVAGDGGAGGDGNYGSSDSSPVGRRPHSEAGRETAQAPASPGLGMTDTQGQYFDHSSSLTFLHRATARLRLSARNIPPNVGDGGATPAQAFQIQHCTGDFALDVDTRQQPLVFPDRNASQELIKYYFDICVVTYRFLHRPTVESWLDQVHRNVDTSAPLTTGIGEMRAAVVICVLAISLFHRGVARQSASEEDGLVLIRRSNVFFHVATGLIDSATGYPSIESVQARLVQILFLLHSSRMNQAWYAFGTVVQCIAALGLHRRSSVAGPRRVATDYILSQCNKRSFWVAYVLDVYLAVMFGRPRHYHDEDLDQELPDRVNDEDMTADGPNHSHAPRDCYVDSLIHHVKIAAIIAKVSSRVYAVNSASRGDDPNEVDEITQMLSQWKDNLPAMFNSVHPSSLTPPFQRQGVALKLAQSHAVMYAFRPLLLRSNGRDPVQENSTRPIVQCLRAAQVALETVVGLAHDGTLYHAFWWTHYVTFVALSVAYGWQIQQQSSTPANRIRLDEEVTQTLLAELPELADRCQRLVQHAGHSFMSKRYMIILEELRQELQIRDPLGNRRRNNPQPPAQPHATRTAANRRNVQGNRTGPSGASDTHIELNTQQQSLRHLNELQAEYNSTPLAQTSSEFRSQQHPALRSLDAGMAYNDTLTSDDPTLLGNASNVFGQWSTMSWLDLDSLAMGTVPGLDIYPGGTIGYPMGFN